MSRFVRRTAVIAFVVAVAVPLVLSPAGVVLADGVPDITLDKSMPEEVLLGAPVPVTLSAHNPTVDGAVPGYNLTFSDVLPLGVSYVPGSSDPEPLVSPGAGGTTVLVWSNVADLQVDTTVTLTFEIVADSSFEVGDTVDNTAQAFVNSDPRIVPLVNTATGDRIGTTATGWAEDTASTEFIPFEISKAEPSPETELLRGVHDHQTVYTLTVRNNLVDPTTEFSIVDYLPAGLEFLGCGNVDNSAPDTEEYLGSGRINPGNAPALTNPCPTPTSVTTVTTDPDGSDPMPTAVYTRVEWDSASLGVDLLPGEVLLIDYVAAIPMQANVQADLADPTANLDNNTGPLTTEDTANGGELALTNYAAATGTYQGDPYTDDTTWTVTAEDLRIHKTSSREVFDQGSTPVFTLDIESSEYSTGTGPITVTDTLPAALDFVSSELDDETFPPSAQVVQSDGTLLITWQIPGFAGSNTDATITLNTVVRDFYRDGTGEPSDEPVSSRDSFTNEVDLSATSTTIIDADGNTGSFPVADDSSVTLTSDGPTIAKEVSEAVDGVMPACGDGEAPGITWTEEVAAVYRPGDRVCWRLEVFFPNGLDTIASRVVDFLPAGFEFVSYEFGPNNVVDDDDPDFDFTDEYAPALIWALPDIGVGGQRFEVVIETVVVDPNASTPGDLLDNLMKFTYQNSAGDVFQERAAASAEMSEAILDLNKGVIELNGDPVVDAPADGVAVQEGDVVTYQLTIENTGTEDALDVSVRDLPPIGITCAAVDIGSISNGGVCTSGTPSYIQWDPADDINIPAGESFNLTYDVTVPVGVSADANLVNHAGVRTYEGVTNQAAPDDRFEYVPADNIDPDLEEDENTSPADDVSNIVTARPVIDKTVASAVDAPGNNGAEQATIGEIVTYTVTLDLPAGVSYYDAQVVDQLDARKDLIAGSVQATLDGTPLPTEGLTVAVDDGANRFTIDFPAVYTIPSGDDQQLVVTFQAVITDVAANVRDAVTDNRVDFNFENAAETVRNVNDTVGVRVVEPNIVLDKTNNDDDGVVDAGQPITYTLTVRNNSGIASVSRAHDTVVTDTVPPQLIVTGPISNGGVYTPGTQPTDPGTIIWNLPPINPGASVLLTYGVEVADPVVAAGELTNFANATTTSYPGTPPSGVERTATSLQGGPGSGYQDPATDTVTVRMLTDAKTAVPEVATVGETITYTVDLTIPAGVIAYDVTMIDQLPDGIIFEALTGVTCFQGDDPCSNPVVDVRVIPEDGYTSGSDVAFFFFDDLTPAEDADRDVTITYTAYVADVPAADAGATLTNQANVYWNGTNEIDTPPTEVPDPDDFDFSSAPGFAEVDTVEPTLVIDKDVAGQVGDTDTRRATPGDVLEYIIVVTNPGTSAAYDVIVTDLIDDPTWEFTPTTTDSTVEITDADPIGGLEWFVAGPIAPNASVTITYTLTVPPDFDSSNENPTGPEQINTADVPSYWGVPEAERELHPEREYREYDDVTPDVVTIELDLASIGDEVWFDVDDNGVWDDGEPPLAGVTVTVTYLGADGALGGGDDEVRVTTTDDDGEYLVEHLPGGQYLVTVDAATLPIGGLAPSYDLDGGTTTPNGAWAGALGEAQDRTDVDFGYTGTGTIGDTIWFDQNGNGVKDANEAGLVGIGVTVTWHGLLPADPADDIVYTATTGVNGLYLVPNLPAGAYTVVVDTDDLPEGMTIVSDPQGPDDSRSELTLGAGASNLDQDFGYWGSGSIGDTIWLDRNGDGVQDIGEPGLAGVTIEVVSFGPDDAPGGGDDSTFTVVTDANGMYLVENLPPGDYQVTVTGGLPANVTNTGDPDDPGPPPHDGDSTSQTTLTIDEPDGLDQDFGYFAESVLGDFVWWDLNSDGVQDPGEPGIPGIEVTATGPNGLTLITTTDDDGNYLFRNLPDGTWTVTITESIPDGFGPTFDFDLVADPGAVPDGVSTTTLVGTDLNQDFGYAGTSSIGDLVWLDLNGDGVVDPGEPGISSVPIELIWFGPDDEPGGGDDVTLLTTTDLNGNYLFPGLPAGEYRVRVVTTDPAFPEAVAPSFDRDGTTVSPDGVTLVTLGADEDIDDADFGFVGGGSIGDTIWLDLDGDGELNDEEVGLGGVTVDLLYHGPDGLPGTVDDETFTIVTAPDGTYLFVGLPAGSYVVTVDTTTLPPGLTIISDPDGGDDSQSAVTLDENESNREQDFGYRGAGSIGDTVYLDLNGNGDQGFFEPGIPGQPVELVWAGPSGPETFTTTTDANGNYLFEYLPDGDYTVRVVGGMADAATNTGDPDGGTPDESELTLAGGVPDLDQDFGYQGANSIGDTVWFDVNADGVDDLGEPRLGGVEITVVWFGPDGEPGGADDVTLPTIATAADGTYLFTGLPDGSYSVTVTGGLPAGTETPTYDADDGNTDPDGISIVVDLGVGSADPDADLDQDFGFTGAGSIGDLVWLDLDGDAVADPGEPGIPGAEVTLTWGGPDGDLTSPDDNVVYTQTTGSDGSYRFDNLPAGDFRVDVANLPTGVTATSDPDGGADDTAEVSLTPGATDLDQDFGYRGGAGIGDTVWLDVDRNGAQNGNEPGLAAVTVTVTSAGVDGVLGTTDDIVVVTETDGDGEYLVTGIPGGLTQVSYDSGVLDAGLAPGSDLDGGDLTVATVVLGAAETRLDVDFGVAGTATIDGTVWVDTDGDGVRDPGEPGIPGVTVEVTWNGPDGPVTQTVVTDSAGNWEIDGVPSGQYEVRVVQSTVPAGFVATTPTVLGATVPPGGTAHVDNGFVPGAAIGDRVWNDTNRNGVQDPGETGVSGVRIDLLNQTGSVVATAVTDVDGRYRFDGLVPATYTVRVDLSTLPQGTVIVADPDGALDGTSVVTVGAGEELLTVDFGIAPPADTGVLPSTGAMVMGAVLVAAVAFGLGWLLLGASRRRRAPSIE